MVDIATRVYDHNWKIDPIVRSLIDTDFYKLLMCQSVFRNKPDAQVTFSLINRSKHVPLANLIDEGELREQLDHIRSLSLSRGESTWLRGNTFYGKRQMFRSDFMEWFENMRLPPYHLERVGDQYELTFEGPGPEVMLWEIPRALGPHGTPLARRPAWYGPVRAASPIRPRHDPRMGEDLRAPRPRRPPPCRFRYPAPPFLPLAGLVRASGDGGVGKQFRRHLQLPHRHEARYRGHWHQRPRTAHGLCSPCRRRHRTGAGPL